MATLTLKSNRSKSINAYLVPLHGLRYMASEMDFGKPKTETDKILACKGKAHDVGIDLAKKESGYYLYQEACHRFQKGYLLIQDGQILGEWQTEEEYAIARANTRAKFPELEGSEKQVVWASSIRAKVALILDYEAIDNWARDGAAYKAMAAAPHAKNWIEWCDGRPDAIAHHILKTLN